MTRAWSRMMYCSRTACSLIKSLVRCFQTLCCVVIKLTMGASLVVVGVVLGYKCGQSFWEAEAHMFPGFGASDLTIVDTLGISQHRSYKPAEWTLPFVLSLSAVPLETWHNYSIGQVRSNDTDHEGDHLGCLPPEKRMEGRVAIVARGGCTFAEKARNAEHAGAAAVLMYDKLYLAPFTLDLLKVDAGILPAIPGMFVAEAVGKSIIAHLEAGGAAHVFAFRHGFITEGVIQVVVILTAARLSMIIHRMQLRALHCIPDQPHCIAQCKDVTNYLVVAIVVSIVIGLAFSLLDYSYFYMAVCNILFRSATQQYFGWTLPLNQVPFLCVTLGVVVTLALWFLTCCSALSCCCGWCARASMLESGKVIVQPPVAAKANGEVDEYADQNDHARFFVKAHNFVVGDLVAFSGATCAAGHFPNDTDTLTRSTGHRIVSIPDGNFLVIEFDVRNNPVSIFGDSCELNGCRISATNRFWTAAKHKLSVGMLIMFEGISGDLILTRPEGHVVTKTNGESSFDIAYTSKSQASQLRSTATACAAASTSSATPTLPPTEDSARPRIRIIAGRACHPRDKCSPACAWSAMWNVRLCARPITTVIITMLFTWTASLIAVHGGTATRGEALVILLTAVALCCSPAVLVCLIKLLRATCSTCSRRTLRRFGSSNMPPLSQPALSRRERPAGPASSMVGRNHREHSAAVRTHREQPRAADSSTSV